jgi:hypothetical protein
METGSGIMEIPGLDGWDIADILVSMAAIAMIFFIQQFIRSWLKIVKKPSHPRPLKGRAAHSAHIQRSCTTKFDDSGWMIDDSIFSSSYFITRKTLELFEGFSCREIIE